MNIASGVGGIPVELFQILKDDAMKVLHSICQQIWKTQPWPQDWRRTVFIPILGKAMSKNAQTTAPLHSSLMLGKQCSKFSKLGFDNTLTMNFQMFKPDLGKAEKPEIKLPTSIGSLKKQENSRKTHTSALLIMPKSLSVWITTHWKILQEMGLSDHLTCLLRNLYAGQEATIRTEHGTIDLFQIGEGVCQGCILSPCLFTLYAEYIMRNTGLEEAQTGIKIARRNINNLRCADDTTHMMERRRTTEPPDERGE